MCAVLWFPQSARRSSFSVFFFFFRSSFIFSSEQIRMGEPERHCCQMVSKYGKAENINVPVLVSSP